MGSDGIVMVEIGKLTPHPRNARVHDIPTIQRSLERFGQVKPIIVQRSTGYIVAGNGTTEAARRLGWTTVKVHVQDMDDATADAYLVADNAASDKSTYDKGKLLDLLGSALSLEGMGFDEDDIEALKEDVNGKSEPSKRAATSSSAAAIEIESRESSASTAQAAEPMREIPLRMSSAALDEFSKLVLELQQAWGARTLIEVVGRAVRETHTRWQAQALAEGKLTSADAIPELAETGF